MRIPSGKTDQSIYFVAFDSNDLVTRLTGLGSFTVYRSRNGAAEVAYTTPTVTEIDAVNMPGVYALLLDEDTTIAAASGSEEYCVHITQASMAPVTRTVELYRPVTEVVIETGYTLEEILRLLAAAALGKVSGSEANLPVFRDINDTVDRVTASVTADGNRTAVTLDPTP